MKTTLVIIMTLMLSVMQPIAATAYYRENNDKISYDVHSHPKQDHQGYIDIPSDEDYNYIVGDKPGVILGYKVNTIKDIDFCGRPQFIKRAKQYIIFYNSNEVLYEKDFNRYKNIVRKINKSK